MNNEDYYVNSVLAAHTPTLSLMDGEAIALNLQPILNEWANGYMDGLYVSGSLAKGTAISGTTDVDILVSLKPSTPDTLQQIHSSLFTKLSAHQLQPRKQNVSIGINGTWQNSSLKIDIVPAKKQNTWANDHSIWSHKTSSWKQTDIHKHIQLVSNSGKANDIKAIKVWRKCQSLDFPSFLLEMSVIRALSGSLSTSPAQRFVKSLEFIRDTLPTARLIDPSNSNNNVADELTQQEKNALSRVAANSLNSNWEQVIW